MEPKWPFVNLGGWLGSLEMVLPILITPTYSTYMEVSFLQGFLGRRRRLSVLGLWTGRKCWREAPTKGKKSSPLLPTLLLRVIWRLMETLNSDYWQKNPGFQVYFGPIGVSGSREGQGLWCALTRKYGEVARGTTAAGEALGSGSVLSELELLLLGLSD